MQQEIVFLESCKSILRPVYERMVGKCTTAHQKGYNGFRGSIDCFMRSLTSVFRSSLMLSRHMLSADDRTCMKQRQHRMELRLDLYKKGDWVDGER